MQSGTKLDVRRARRQRALKNGEIVLHSGASIDCVVSNISDTGACLVVESQVDIADAFALFLEANQPARRCRVAWRKGNRIGVAFVKTI